MKTKYFESKPGVLVCALTGAEYKYTVSDKTTRQTAIAKLTAEQATALERMQQEQPKLTVRQHFGLEPVPHLETRSPREIRAAHAKQQPKQPTGVPAKPVNPFETTIEAEIGRHHAMWETTFEGRRVIANLKRESKKWEAAQEQKRQQQDFKTSIAPMIDHARKALDDVRRDPANTVAEVEAAEARLKLAQSGDFDSYREADTAWRMQLAERIQDQAVEVDSQIRTLAAKRDSLLQAAYQPINEAAEPQLVPVSYPDFYHDSAKAGKTIMEPMPQ